MSGHLLAEHLNVKLLSQFDVPKLNSFDLINLNKSNGWSGASFLCGEQPVILFNRNHSAARTESTIMHELSHIILNHKPKLDERIKHLSLLFRNYDEIHEREAKWLGGCLQIPVEGLVSALLKGKTIDQIATQFLSSLEMTKFRINTSGALQRVKFIKMKSR